MRIRLWQLVLVPASLGILYQALVGSGCVPRVPPALAREPSIYPNARRGSASPIEPLYPHLVPVPDPRIRPDSAQATPPRYPLISPYRDRTIVLASVKRPLAAGELVRFVDDFVQSGYFPDGFNQGISFKRREEVQAPAGPAVKLTGLYSVHGCTSFRASYARVEYTFQVTAKNELVCVADRTSL